MDVSGRTAPILRHLAGGVAAMLWFFGGWESPVLRRLDALFVSLPDAAINRPTTFWREPMESWIVGDLPLTPLWPAIALGAAACALLISRAMATRVHVPAFLRGKTFLLVAFYVVFRALLLAPPRDLLDRIGQGLVLLVFLILLLSRPRPVTSLTRNSDASGGLRPTPSS